jgi:hypothetical protein
MDSGAKTAEKESRRVGLALVSALGLLAGCASQQRLPLPVWRVDRTGKPAAVDLSRSGVYFCGRWQYVLDLRNRGYARQALHGSLFREGAVVLPKKSKSVVETPWGKMRFHRYGAHPSGRIGWLPVEQAHRPRELDQSSSP